MWPTMASGLAEVESTIARQISLNHDKKARQGELFMAI